MAEQGDTVRGVPKTVAIVGVELHADQPLEVHLRVLRPALAGARARLPRRLGGRGVPARVCRGDLLVFCVRFGARVVALEPSEGVGESRCTVTWEPVVLGSGVGAGAGVDASGGGASRAQSFDFGVVASGVFSKSHLPDLAGLRGFAGQLSHASAYREPGPFEGKRVLVVGAAFSGADIAADIATTAASVVVAARRPMWYLPRYIKGRPADLAFYSRAGADAAAGSSEEERSAKRHRFFASVVGDVPASVRLPDPARGDVPFVPYHVHHRWLPGRRALRAGGRACRVRGRAVGRRRDLLVGRRGGLRRGGARDGLPAGAAVPAPSAAGGPGVRRGRLAAARRAARVRVAPRVPQLLAFVGLYRGPYFAAMELQARWACGVFSGRLQRPGAEELERGLQRERDVRAKLPRQQFPHGDYVGMVEALARRVGVHPQQLLNDSSGEMYQLLYKGPLLPFHYRLVGFQSKPEVASRAIRECVTKHPLPIE
ncbi:unnamed protein product [Prorocentrum cordatum]|uniref:Flavin-containing monooxygenase n=1 Tax=Prorocentrum cordatum TaxID=2364126 RepID=A0ABN9WSM3_9DINO|nr:unnamed protein product [Polarella glacialis]